MVSIEERERAARLIYAICKRIDGYPEKEGTFQIMGLRVGAIYDYHERQSFYEPLSTYDELLELTQLNHRLFTGYAPEWACNRLLVSFRMFESIYDAPLGRVPLPHPGEAEKGIHAVAVVGGWDNAGESLRFANSWGTRWGDRGCGLLSREYLDRYMVDAYIWRNVRVGPSRFTYPRLMHASTAKDFARAWMQENPRERVRFRYRGHGHQYVIYETLSVAGWPIQIIEVRNGRGWRLGWAYLHHVASSEPRVSVLKELFVWPSFRRQGYGTLLESQAANLARLWHSSAIHILFHEVDALPRNRTPGRTFAEKADYTFRWRRHKCPNLAAIAVKSL
jgi:GNAT superfamily N-acetyltransferase